MWWCSSPSLFRGKLRVLSALPLVGHHAKGGVHGGNIVSQPLLSALMRDGSSASCWGFLSKGTVRQVTLWEELPSGPSYMAVLNQNHSKRTSKRALVQLTAPRLKSRVTVGQFLKLSEPQCPHLHDGGNSLTGLLGKLSGINKSLAHSPCAQ